MIGGVVVGVLLSIGYGGFCTMNDSVESLQMLVNIFLCTFWFYCSCSMH